MKIIQPKAFAAYAVVGTVVAAVITSFIAWKLWSNPNPNFPAYTKLKDEIAAETQKLEQAKAVRQAAEKTRPFQEVLLGETPADSLPDGPVRRLANTLRDMAPSDASDRMATTRAMTDLPTLMNTDCLRVKGESNSNKKIAIKNSWYACSTVEYQLVRTEPYRIASLLHGDRTALTPLPEVPEPSAQYAAFEKLPVEPKLIPVPLTGFHYSLLWLAFSGAFALAYSATGWLFGDEKNEDPIRAVPGFVLGWLIMLATFPGFLLVYGLWLTKLVLTGDVASAIKKLNAKRTDALKLKLGNNLLATLKAHTEVNGYRDLAVRVVLEPDNLRRALAANVLPESSKDEVEEYISMCGDEPQQTPRAAIATPFGGGGS